MAEDKIKDWQVPPQAYTEDKILGWVNEAHQEGLIWHKSQRSYWDYKKAFDIFSGRSPAAPTPNYRSQMSTGHLKRNVREIVGAVSNIRPIWGYGTDNPSFNSECEMMNSVTRAIYLERFLDGSIKEAMQWSAATGTGWIRPMYKRDMYGTGKGNLTFLTYGSPCVLPVQLPNNNDWQNAYAVTLVDELPIAMAHGMFPEFQDRLKPTASKYWYANEIRKSAKGNLVQRIFTGGRNKKHDTELPDLFVPIRYTYIIDLTINETDQMIPMGKPGSSWYYEVPAYKSDVPNGFNSNGEPVFKKATADDARLYPFRRLIISSEDVRLYDGPAFDWHGELPLIPFRLDDWVWEALGIPLVAGSWQIQGSIDELERGVMDKHAASIDPPLAYDINAVGKNEAERFDPMGPRTRCGFDGSLTERPFQDVLPESYRKVDPMIPAHINHLEEVLDYQLALKDVMSLAKARSGGGIDDYEKLLEAGGPIVEDISRNCERSLSHVGSQTKYIILQWYTTPRIMQYVGANGVTRHTFDYDPGSLVPSHMPDENTDTNSKYSKIQRARIFANNLRFFLTPHSVHEITQMAHKLLLIQLRKAGIQIDSRTIAEACDISNFGSKPDGNTVWERYWNEQNEIAMHAIYVKQLVDSITAQGVMPTPAMQNAIGDTLGTPPVEGRPTTGQESPKLVQKDGGERSTISESGS